MIKVAPYYKAVTAGVGEVITAGTAITTLLALVPQDYRGVAAGMSVLLAALGFVKVLYVYLVKNEPLAEAVDAAVESAGPVVRDVAALNKHQAVEPVVAKVAAADNATTLPADGVQRATLLPPGFVPGPGAR